MRLSPKIDDNSMGSANAMDNKHYSITSLLFVCCLLNELLFTKKKTNEKWWAALRISEHELKQFFHVRYELRPYDKQIFLNISSQNT